MDRFGSTASISKGEPSAVLYVVAECGSGGSGRRKRGFNCGIAIKRRRFLIVPSMRNALPERVNVRARSDQLPCLVGTLGEGNDE